MDGLGCSPANGNVPSRQPAFASLGKSSSTLRAPQSELGKIPLEPPWGYLGKTAHFTGTLPQYCEYVKNKVPNNNNTNNNSMRIVIIMMIKKK